MWRPSHNLLARRSTPSDIQKLAAVDYGDNNPGGYIYTSDDSGVTWTARATDALRPWQTIASSSDGSVRQFHRLRPGILCVPAVLRGGGYVWRSSPAFKASLLDY